MKRQFSTLSSLPQEVHTKPRRNGLVTGRSFVAQCRILRYYEGRF
nr:MAG TPA: hypothetical protein [Caudoviricetes sp.]